MNRDQVLVIYGYGINSIPVHHTQYISEDVEIHFVDHMQFNESNKLSKGYQKFVEKMHHKKVIFYQMNHQNDKYIGKIVTKYCCDPLIIDQDENNIDHIKSLITASTPILYIVNGSVFSWRILMLCYHHGINFVARRLKVMGTINYCQTEEFTHLNPRQKTPVWVNESDIIYESLAIILYLANSYNLIDTKNHTKYGTIMRLIMESENLIVQLRNYDNLLYHPERVGMNQEMIEKYIDKELDHWSKYLDKHKYFGNIVQDGLNLIDITIYPLFGWMIYKDYHVKPRHYNLAEYESRMRSEYCVKWSRPLFWKNKSHI